MNLTAVLEQRYDRTPDGRVWTPGPHGAEFWARYLEVFGAVRVVARVRDVPEVGDRMRPAGGPGVSFVAVPHFIGPAQYLRVKGRVRRAIAAAVLDPQAGAVLLRVPGTLSNEAFRALGDRPFAAEVVGDPYALFAPRVSRHPLRAFFRQMYTRQLQAQCRRARVVAYVTREALQRRYPSPGRMFGLSDVDLPPQAYAARGRSWHAAPHEAVMVCTLQFPYKGVDLAISALPLLRARGLDLRLRVVGEGAERPALETQASALGVAAQVEFVGAVPGGAGVREQLDRADVFLMPSWQEGLPRAMVEAMARGLPVLGSEVGGIPELIGPGERFPTGDPTAIAAALEGLLGDPGRYEALGERNLGVAHTYSNEALGEVRREFYRAVRDLAGH
ncbi:glycosyltransferase [uncultured Deinococcus sp.]|uniref:glycosyltransferase n=1 Tax=uncultured Deinococcus sp. TaxID=158789 RepID=UPI00258D5DEA|nr:glycosyltransferase [uncultured Deinococcus sp.]